MQTSKQVNIYTVIVNDENAYSFTSAILAARKLERMFKASPMTVNEVKELTSICEEMETISDPIIRNLANKTIKIYKSTVEIQVDIRTVLY